MEQSEWARHDQIENALFETKSLEALAYLLDAGRELEFSYHGAMGFISCSGSKSGVSLWMNRTEQSFADIMELMDHAMIEGRAFRSAWNEIEIETLF